MLKKLFILTGFLISTTFSFSQEIDSRILKNKGKEAEKMYVYNKNSYNYLLFELDHSYEVVSIKSLSKEQRNSIKKDISFTDSEKVIIGTSNFNFYDFGIKLSKSERQYVQLDKERVIVFYAIPEVTKAFTTSPSNTK
ncbi:hypothetical protein [Fluviicola taffensis]|uniref:Uncharacterized protein n=1 Tax=Fluviicola taffensis (strain DSM 16823 / NCIMB 13979 / RW262) TaxID=755732 RepID=F2IHK2_FLUTR|nr:hypothetical protein [Fluviicola taffensis]AEA43767.1 hypothetical protein Fluta_1777 [Fluviicola taffensis DSM 16823]